LNPEDEFPTYRGLVKVISDELNRSLQDALADTPLVVEAFLDPATLELRFDFQFDITRSVEVDLNLADNFTALGLQFETTPVFTFTVGLSLDAGFGVNLSFLTDLRRPQ